MARGNVFVTGASTGIGRATVERLAADGYLVIAGVRRDADAPPAAKSHVIVDLAESESVVRAAKEVLAQTNGTLDALVNNAGININGPFETVPIEEWRRQFEVNVFGQVTLTRELLPAILASQGRIITVGSVGGRFSAPFLGPYSASKFAVRGWMDALRHELAPHGVRAILVEPGAVETAIWGKGNSYADDMLANLTDEQRKRYAKQIDGARTMANFAERNAVPAEKAAAVIATALASRHPSGRYLVGADARVQAVVAAAPTRVLDLVTRLLLRQPRRP